MRGEEGKRGGWGEGKRDRGRGNRERWGEGERKPEKDTEEAQALEETQGKILETWALESGVVKF